MPHANTLDVALRAYVPAHELTGTLMPETVTLSNINACREATGLTWEPAAEPQYRIRRLGPGMESAEVVPGFKYVTRGEGGPVLGSMRDSYHLFPNRQLFSIAETLGTAALEQKRPVRFVSGGETGGGKRVYLLADMGVVEIPGDPSPHVRYVTLLSSHNGAGAVKVLGTSNRWVCTNALHAAEVEATGKGAAFSFRHTSKIDDRLRDAREAMIRALVEHRQIEQRTREMLQVKVKPAAVSDYLSQFALAQVVSKGNPHRKDKVDGSAARDNAVAKWHAGIRTIWESPTCDGIRETAYGAFAAVVEYLDHKRAVTSNDAYFDRTMVITERGKVLAYQLGRSLF